MGLNFAAGMSAATGYMQGRDEATARDIALEDREYQRTQRQYQQGQEARQLAEQQRADTLRTNLSQVQGTTTTPGTAQDDGAGNMIDGASQTVTAPVPQDVQMRQAAAAYGKAGEFAKAIELHQQADKVGWDRSAKMFSDLQAQAVDPSLTAVDVANQAAKIYGQDPFAGKVSNVRDDGNGGVIIDASSRETGQTVTRRYANKAALLDSLQAYYSPQTYAALQAKRQEALLKVQEEQGKPIVVPAGGALAVNGKIQATNNNGMIQVGTEPDGVTPILVRGSARVGPDGNPIAGGAGGGRGAGGIHTQADAASKAFEAAATKGDAKLTPAQYSQGAALTQQIMSQGAQRGVTPEIAADVATQVIMNPALEEPSINPKTGQIVSVFNHPRFGQFVTSEVPPKDLKPEQMKKATQTMLEAQDPKLQPQLLAAAFNDDARTRLASSVQGEIDAALHAQVANDPQHGEAIQVRADATKRATMQAIDAKLKLIKEYGTPPGKDAKKADAPARIAASYAQVAGIRRAVAANPLRPQVEPDAADRAVVANRNTPTPEANAAKAAKQASLQSAGLTPEKIKAMRPSEAKSYIDKFDDVLDPQTLRLLQRQL